MAEGRGDGSLWEERRGTGGLRPGGRVELIPRSGSLDKGVRYPGGSGQVQPIGRVLQQGNGSGSCKQVPIADRIQ